MGISASYAGSLGANLANMTEGNPIPPTSIIDGRPFWAGNGARINPNWDNYSLKSFQGKSWYNSAQIRLQNGVNSSLQYQVSYTLAKALDIMQ